MIGQAMKKSILAGVPISVGTPFSTDGKLLAVTTPPMSMAVVLS